MQAVFEGENNWILGLKTLGFIQLHTLLHANMPQKSAEKPAFQTIHAALIFYRVETMGYHKTRSFSTALTVFFGDLAFSSLFTSFHWRSTIFPTGELEMRMGMMERNVLRHQVGRVEPAAESWPAFKIEA